MGTFQIRLSLPFLISLPFYAMCIRSIVLLCLLACLGLAPAKTDAQVPLTDIRPLLKVLKKEQKLQLLEYLRHLGTSIDDEIQNSYQGLSKKSQLQTVQYIETLKQDPAKLPVTAVQWSRDTIFFGEVQEGSPVIDSFVVTNTGDQPYLISRYTTTCDCTVLKYPEHPVMPGEKAILRAEFDTRSKAGTATPAIIVYDNSSPNRRSILFLKGLVSPRKQTRKKPWDD